MNVIGDGEADIMVMALMIDWGVSQLCQVDGCDDPTTTIVALGTNECPDGETHTIGICKKHYQEMARVGKLKQRVNLWYRKANGGEMTEVGDDCQG